MRLVEFDRRVQQLPMSLGRAAVALSGVVALSVGVLAFHDIAKGGQTLRLLAFWLLAVLGAWVVAVVVFVAFFMGLLFVLVLVHRPASVEPSETSGAGGFPNI